MGVVASAVASISLDSVIPFVQMGHGSEGKEELKEIEGGSWGGDCLPLGVAPWIFWFCR